ncbi:hypothetical protein ACFYOV_16635 [Streptomyces sp. NPDC005931]|uniref:hypothetical protein n=1 Tax=Streptomyces sp. NPDC005931 TaxID=3364737 RepID=UPI0036C11C50
MSEGTTAATDLTSQYTAQVADDLERNVKEQERVSAEITELQRQLAVLQHDHTVLVNMQQALGLTPAPAEPAGTPEDDSVSESATVPAPRGDSGAKSGAGKQKRGRKTATSARSTARKPTARRTAGGRSGEKPSAEKPSADKSSPEGTRGVGGRAAKPEAAGTQSQKVEGPTLVDLVRRHLTEQSEPRSAAEVATALGQAHSGRTFKTTVVRSTLEGLVARNQAQRTKQGSSVFYTAPDGTERSPENEEATQS